MIRELQFSAILRNTSAQWARFSKNLQKLIIPDPAHICQFQFRVKVKLHEESESGPKNLKKVYFQAQIGFFVVLATMINHTKTHMGT
jgi:hypothetical protein